MILNGFGILLTGPLSWSQIKRIFNPSKGSLWTTIKKPRFSAGFGC
jgi:hypothetical protein